MISPPPRAPAPGRNLRCRARCFPPAVRSCLVKQISIRQRPCVPPSSALDPRVCTSARQTLPNEHCCLSASVPCSKFPSSALTGPAAVQFVTSSASGPSHFRCRDRDRSKRRLFAGIVYHAALINRGKLEVPAKVGSRQSAAREEDNAEVTADLRTRAIASGCG